MTRNRRLFALTWTGLYYRTDFIMRWASFLSELHNRVGYIMELGYIIGAGYGMLSHVIKGKYFSFINTF